jgi:hypothetical protein
MYVHGMYIVCKVGWLVGAKGMLRLVGLHRRFVAGVASLLVGTHAAQMLNSWGLQGDALFASRRGVFW